MTLGLQDFHPRHCAPHRQGGLTPRAKKERKSARTRRTGSGAPSEGNGTTPQGRCLAGASTPGADSGWTRGFRNELCSTGNTQVPEGGRPGRKKSPVYWNSIKERLSLIWLQKTPLVSVCTDRREDLVHKLNSRGTSVQQQPEARAQED